jgi:hypothetical protein
MENAIARFVEAQKGCSANVDPPVATAEYDCESTAQAADLTMEQPMTDRSNDALAYWQKMFVEVQKGFNVVASQAMESSQLSKMMTSPAGTGAQKQLGELMEKYLVSMNMPSRAQMTGLDERLQGVEGQLNEIKLLLQRTQTNATAPQGAPFAPVRPPRTKRAPVPPADEAK